MDRGYTVKREVHPKDTANLISLLTFRYVHKVLKKGNTKDLQEDDICEVWKKFHVNKLGNKITDLWYRQADSTKKRSIIKVLLTCFLRKYLLIGLLQLFGKILNVVVVPYCFGQLINYFKVGQTEIRKQEACFYATIVVITNLFCLILDQQYILYKVEVGLEVTSALFSLLYRKLLRLSSSSISEISTGKIVTIITKDIGIMEESTYIINDIWIETFQGFVIFYLLFVKVGFPAVFGLGCYVVTVIVQAIIAKVIYKERLLLNQKSDKRFKLIQEVLTSIRVIKMYTWEKFFSSKVSYARTDEVKQFGKMTFIKFSGFFLGNICDKLSFFMTILFYLYLGNNLTAEVVYYSEMCFQKLKLLVTYVMTSCAFISAEFLASVHRLELILHAEEMEEVPKFSKSFILPKVEFISANICLGNVIILKNINLKLGTGFNLLVGPMDCGKSLLLKSILGEYPTINGKINIEGVVSYAPQNSWIFPSSIRQNILFGQPYNEQKYKKILEVCALSFDLEFLAERDETVIRDCDMNISKGQQARINIARALYKESDIYIFDDPFASLDNNVRNHILHEMQKYLKNKLVILATSEATFINEANVVIIMLKGRVSFVGKPKDAPKELYKSLRNDIVIHPSAVTTDNDNVFDESSSREDSRLNLPAFSSEKTNIYCEDQEAGVETGWKAYMQYFSYGGGAIALVAILTLYILVEVSSGSSEKLLSKWIEIEENLTTIDDPTSSDVPSERAFYLNWYIVLMVTSCIIVTTSITAHFIFSLNIARNLHKTMMGHVIGATMSFFDSNMSGNILNRFSKDLYQVDDFLPFFMSSTIMTCASLFSTAALISSVNVEFTILTLGLVLTLFLIARYCIRPIKRFKKLENSTRSPIVGYFNATIDGLVTIRAYGTQQILAKEFDKHQSIYLSARHLFEICLSCLSFSLTLASTLFTSLIIVRFLAVGEGTSTADVGLAITQSFVLRNFLDHGVKQWVSLESLMICFQRTAEYTRIVQENKTGQIVENWPSDGCIKFKSVNFIYKMDKELVLKDLNFTIRPKEKIGVVGRTGAGKSSLILTLFRLYETQGTIFIDNVDIKTVPSEYLRSKIAIIPQDPLTFSGSIRDNIDPCNNYTDNQIWRALNAVSLKPHIKSLDDDINKCAAAYSFGQKQLLCLARAIIRETKIVVLDEATSNMDEETGILIHSKIDELFAECTVITIAHRLKLVMNYDRIMVMEKGEIVEFDNPKSLILNKDSRFHQMVNEVGDH